MSRSKSEKLSRENRSRLEKLGVELFLRRGVLTDHKFSMSMRTVEKPNGTIFLDSRLPARFLNEALEKELDHLENDENSITSIDQLRTLIESLDAHQMSDVSVNLSGIVIPEDKTEFGTLVVAQAKVFDALINALRQNWDLAFDIPPYKWEEIVAGAFDRSGFDEVVLTPRSGDYGRDVIAIKKGVGCIKVLSSVKAYKPKLLVGYDDIRALLGVMSGERDTSKGIIITTSAFPPNVMTDPNIAPFIPTRLELMDGAKLREWLSLLVQTDRSLY